MNTAANAQTEPVVVGVTPNYRYGELCRNPWLLYEKEKRKLQAANPSTWDFECAIKRLCARLCL